MAQLCCPEMFFSHWGGSAIGRAFVQRNKKLLRLAVAAQVLEGAPMPCGQPERGP